MMLAALALRDEIGEPVPGEAPTLGDRRLCYVQTQYASRRLLDDPPMQETVGGMVLDDLLVAYDDFDARPADVAGPVFVDYDRALALADKYGATFGGVNFARAEVEELTERGWVIVACGAHWEYPA